MVRIQGDRLMIILDLEGFVRIALVLQTSGSDFANEQSVSFLHEDYDWRIRTSLSK